LRRLGRVPAMIACVDDEAEALIEAFGVGAYSEARRREQEASSDAIAMLWGRVDESRAIGRGTHRCRRFGHARRLGRAGASRRAA